MTLPAFVTFTGLDASVDLDRVEALSRRYPIEWGILFSPKLQGSGRYPSLDAVERLTDRPFRRAAHVCGGYARSVVETGECAELQAVLSDRFSRIQINTPRTDPDRARIARFAASVTPGARAILQCRDPESFPDDPAVDWLYDRSAGNGVLPEAWPRPSTGALVGYAGGLGPETVAPALARIASSHPAGTPYWIDMETRIRDAEDRLDLDRCEAVLRSVYPDA
jgi:hypothetical protein